MERKTCKNKELNGIEYRCFFELALKIIGGKWKPMILFHIAIQGVMRFGELRRGIGEITERMLTKQLRELEEHKIINRKVYQQVPPKVEYSLTEMGCSLIPILLSMREWGVKYEESMVGKDHYNGDEYESKEALKVKSNCL